MTRILVLGAAGMLGHKLVQTLVRDQFVVSGTVRSLLPPARIDAFAGAQIAGGVDAAKFDSVVNAFALTAPDVVVNCIGIVKQLPEANDAIQSLTINSLFPHLLARQCQAAGARLIHLSTDCVFSGRRGMYTEEDFADADDLYGRSKLMGEVGAQEGLTLRTSMIGRELKTRHGLLEWFLSQTGRIRGFTNAIYSGFTTIELSRIISLVIRQHADLRGVYHVSSAPVSKYDLLKQLREAFEHPIEIDADPSVKIDRSLDSTRFRTVTGYTPSPWESMIREMAADPSPYRSWRSDSAA